MHLASVALVTDPKVSVKLIMDSSSNKYGHLSIAFCYCNAMQVLWSKDARALSHATCARIAHIACERCDRAAKPTSGGRSHLRPQNFIRSSCYTSRTQWRIARSMEIEMEIRNL